MTKPKKERRFFGLFPGRSNSFAPARPTPASNDDGNIAAAVVLGTIIGSDPGPGDERHREDSPSGYDHPADDPVRAPSYESSPSHYDYGSSSSYDGGSSSYSGGYDSGGGGSSDGGGGGGGD